MWALLALCLGVQMYPTNMNPIPLNDAPPVRGEWVKTRRLYACELQYYLGCKTFATLHPLYCCQNVGLMDIHVNDQFMEFFQKEVSTICLKQYNGRELCPNLQENKKVPMDVRQYVHVWFKFGIGMRF